MATGFVENIALAKVTSMVVLGGAAFICMLIPVFIDRNLRKKNSSDAKRSTREDFIVCLMLSFGGGVLLSTTFLHLLPEVTESVEELQKDGRLPKIPLSIPELIMCCGFFIMYFVEEIVHKIMHSRRVKSVKEGCDNPLAVSVDSEVSVTDAYKEILKEDNFKVAYSPPYEEDVKIIPTTQKTYSSFTSSEVDHNHGCNHNSHYDHDHQPNDHHGNGDHHIVGGNSTISLRELLIVLALTVHEGFEGCAIGLEGTVGGVWYLTFAVAIHKSVIAFCIGVELVSGQVSNKLTALYTAMFSCASPLGVGIGFALSSSTSSTTSVASVMLQGIATGTLLYVVFFEVLKRDHNSGGGLCQMMVVILGFVCMAVLMSLIDA